MPTPMPEPALTPPAGFTAVSREAFFAAVGSCDVHPRNNRPNSTDWETPRRELFGWSSPGWRNPGAHPPIYALRQA